MPDIHTPSGPSKQNFWSGLNRRIQIRGEWKSESGLRQSFCSATAPKFNSYDLLSPVAAERLGYNRNFWPIGLNVCFSEVKSPFHVKVTSLSRISSIVISISSDIDEGQAFSFSDRTAVSFCHMPDVFVWASKIFLFP
jgi:hypothetical protein